MVEVDLVSDTGCMLAVNAARVSFAKRTDKLRDADTRLLEFLADNNHWTPFGHVRIGIRTRSKQVADILYNTPIKDGASPHSLLRTGIVGCESAGYYYLSLTAYNLVGLYNNLSKKDVANELGIILITHLPKISDAFGITEDDVNLDIKGSRWAIEFVPEHEMPRDIATVTVHCKMPVSIARQVFKSNHETIVYNEVSRRYVALWPKFKNVLTWRRAAKNKKQGSSGSTNKLLNLFATFVYNSFCMEAMLRYKMFIKLGIAPEQARFILPQGMEVEFYMTGVVKDLVRVVNLRKAPDAQLEVQVFASLLDDAIHTKVWNLDVLDIINNDI